jgi:TolA-binding protein
MKQSVQGVTAIFVLFILTAFHMQVKAHYQRPEIYLEQISKLEKKWQEEKVKHLITSFHMQDFRQSVATILPRAIQEKKSYEKSYPLRSLASVLQKNSKEHILNLKSDSTFQAAARLYSEKKYTESIEIFKGLIINQPYSAKIPEAMFLLVDSYYNLNRYAEALEVYEKMIDLYPELEVTGYAMLRVGKIYEYHNKSDMAVDLYKTIISTFTEPNLRNLAHTSLRTAEL